MNVSKSRRRRLEELRQALVIIDAGLRSASEDEAHLVPVMGQLRALLVDGKKPLLIDLAEAFNFPLEFFSFPLDILDRSEWQHILGSDRMQWTGDSVSPVYDPPCVHKVVLGAWLDSTQVVVGDTKISGRRLIRDVANKLGGAHYDPKWPRELEAMMQVELGGMASPYRTLVRLAEVVIHLGQELLEHMRELEP